MRRNLLRFLRLQKESLVPRSSVSARFSGVTTPRRKLLGNERRILDKTIHTFLLANPNLEDEIHLKGGRFVTSQFYQIWMLIESFNAYHISLHFGVFKIFK